MEIIVTIKLTEEESKKLLNEVKVEETEEKSETKSYSDYARFFDELCPGWTKDAEYNLNFLRIQQQYANEILKTKGHIFLNEVYDLIGIPHTKAGQVVGWVYDKDNPIGDNFVDFGLYNLETEQNVEFVNGRKRTILLDFNVDGNILDRIEGA